MAYDTSEIILASDVADSGTFTVGYKPNRDPGDYEGGSRHQVTSNSYGTMSVQNGKASFSFGASEVTITNSSGQVLPAGTKVYVQMDRLGADSGMYGLADADKMATSQLVIVNLGAPDTADADGAVASQSATSANGLATGINGALATGGVATFDVPRNVVAGWTNTAILTVTGTDAYGKVVVESSASGTSMAGKKAFKTVTGISVNANVTGLTVGSGDVLGLPVYLPQTGLVLGEIQDGAAAAAGTVVAGVTTKATATTGDVRGTYDPDAACNGARAIQLVLAIPDPSARGSLQFAG